MRTRGGGPPGASSEISMWQACVGWSLSSPTLVTASPSPKVGPTVGPSVGRLSRHSSVTDGAGRDAAATSRRKGGVEGCCLAHALRMASISADGAHAPAALEPTEAAPPRLDNASSIFTTVPASFLDDLCVLSEPPPVGSSAAPAAASLTSSSSATATLAARPAASAAPFSSCTTSSSASARADSADSGEALARHTRRQPSTPTDTRQSDGGGGELPPSGGAMRHETCFASPAGTHGPRTMRSPIMHHACSP